MKRIERFEINERVAKLAKEYNSMSSYVKNSATDYYNEKIDEAEELVNDDNLEKFNYWSKKVADYINKENEINARYPSVLIVGAGNFNNKKKEAQNRARAKLYDEDYPKLNYYFNKARNYVKKEINEDAEKEVIFECDLFKAIKNEEENRLQLEFECKPDPEVIAVLKANAFRFAPSTRLWQRVLTTNAMYALGRVKKDLNVE